MCWKVWTHNAEAECEVIYWSADGVGILPSVMLTVGTETAEGRRQGNTAGICSGFL